MNSARYKNTMQYILPLMAVSSLISQSLVDLFLIICVGTWLYFFIKERNRNEFLPYTGLEWAFVGLFVAMLLSVLVNYWGQWEYLWPVHKIKWVVEFYAMVWFLRRFGFNVRTAFASISIVSLIPSVYVILSYFNGTDFINPHKITSDRVVGLVNSATYHAHAGAILFVMLISFYLSMAFDRGDFLKVKNFLIRAIPALMLGVTVFLTYTRGALGAIVVSFLAVGFLINRRLGAVILIVLMGLGGIAMVTSERFHSRVMDSVDFSRADGDRVALLRSHFAMFAEHPIFGLGYDAYKHKDIGPIYTSKYKVSEDLLNSHAHNQYLQLASSTGLLGLLFFLIILFRLIHRAVHNLQSGIRRQRMSYSVIPALCISVLFFTDQSFEYAKIRAVILFAWALIFVENDEEVNNV